MTFHQVGDSMTARGGLGGERTFCNVGHNMTSCNAGGRSDLSLSSGGSQLVWPRPRDNQAGACFFKGIPVRLSLNLHGPLRS